MEKTSFILRVVLLGYWLLFFLLAVVLRSWAVWKTSGKWPIILDHPNSLRGFVISGMKVLFLLVAVAIFVFGLWPSAYRYLAPISFLESPAIQILGLAFLGLALPWILVAQANMASSFRIGIDDKNRTKLITGGLFRHSRNPIFFGTVLSCLGQFLATPNALTLVILAVCYVLIGMQIRMEEEFLLARDGEAYGDYMRKVRRWI
jgi:protein-S-isoprenylcysteine O-methyltransferase Ste14